MSISDNTKILNQQIIMIYKLEAYEEDNPFTRDQRKWLSDKIEEAEELDFNITKPFKFVGEMKKFKRIGEEYEQKFKEWGGNTERLEKKVTEMRDDYRSAAMPFIPRRKK